MQASAPRLKYKLIDTAVWFFMPSRVMSVLATCSARLFDPVASISGRRNGAKLLVLVLVLLLLLLLLLPLLLDYYYDYYYDDDYYYYCYYYYEYESEYDYYCYCYYYYYDDDDHDHCCYDVQGEAATKSRLLSIFLHFSVAHRVGRTST